MEKNYIQDHAFELCEVPIYAVDKDCCYTFLNTAYQDLVKRSRGLSIYRGQSHIEVVSAGSGIDRVRVLEAFKRVMSGERFQAIDIYGEPDFYRAPYEITYNPVIEEGGEIAGMIVLAQDITDRIKLQDQLNDQKIQIGRQAAQLEDAGILKDKLLSVIAHDLRSPIANLNLCIQLIEEHKLSPEETLKLISMVGRSTRAIYKTLDDLLEWSMSKPNFDKPDIEPIRLSVFFNDQVNLYATLADQKKVVLKVSAPDETICADRRKVSLLIRNFIDNAIKYTGTNGFVEVGLIREQNSCRMYCINSGKIESRIKKKILDEMIPFHTTGTHGEKGTGLGLILCKEILAGMNTTLEITNRSDHTIFSFVLPEAGLPVN